jgi:hypothetical protein
VHVTGWRSAVMNWPAEGGLQGTRDKKRNVAKSTSCTALWTTCLRPVPSVRELTRKVMAGITRSLASRPSTRGGSSMVAVTTTAGFASPMLARAHPARARFMSSQAQVSGNSTSNALAMPITPALMIITAEWMVSPAEAVSRTTLAGRFGPRAPAPEASGYAGCPEGARRALWAACTAW